MCIFLKFEPNGIVKFWFLSWQSYQLSGCIVLTIESFIPILPRSSISLLSDMWFPIPILLFIWISACCSQQIIIHQHTKPIWKKRDGLVTKQTCISCAISGVRFICWFIPDLAASIVDTVKSLIASCTFSSVARWDLVQELINEPYFINRKICRPTKGQKNHSKKEKRKIIDATEIGYFG